MSMEHLRIVTIVIVALQCSMVCCHLPLLPGNKLLTGDAAEIPGTTLIEGVKDLILSEFQTSNTFNPSAALVSGIFERYPFTSHADVPGSLVNGGIGRFSIVKLKHGVLHPRRAFALTTDEEYGEFAYWLPHGGYVDVPQHPDADQPQFVFTPDFSGCSWTVTPMAKGMLRLRHVEGGHEDQQFNNLPSGQKGGPVSYGMQVRDYSYVKKNGKLIKHATAYAYMKYSDSRWTLHVQNYFNQNSWDHVMVTDFWDIPPGEEMRL